MGDLLGPDGESVKPHKRLEVQPGTAVDITVSLTTTIQIDAAEIILPPGHWRILPFESWKAVVARAAQLEMQVEAYQAALHMEPDEQGELPAVSRHERRRALKTIR